MWPANLSRRKLPASSGSSEAPKWFDAPLSWRSAMSSKHAWLREKHYWFFFSDDCQIPENHSLLQNLEEIPERLYSKDTRQCCPGDRGLNLTEAEQRHHCWYYDCCLQLWAHNHRVCDRGQSIVGIDKGQWQLLFWGGWHGKKGLSCPATPAWLALLDSSVLKTLRISVLTPC